MGIVRRREVRLRTRSVEGMGVCGRTMGSLERQTWNEGTIL